MSPKDREEGHKYFDCPKVWERIVSHPKFDDVDVEALCAELNAKVAVVLTPPKHPGILEYSLILVGCEGSGAKC